MNFRSAKNTDSKLIITLVFNVLAEYGLKPNLEEIDSDLTNIEANYNNRNGIFELLENDDGIIIATFGLYKIDEEIVELRKMYLINSERGKGYGKLLLARAIEKATTLGYKKIILETASVLKEAIQLYISYGFQPFIADHLSERCDQAYYLDLKIFNHYS